MFVKTEQEHLIRDTHSRAIIVEDNSARKKFSEQKKFEQRMKTLEMSVEQLMNKFDQLINILNK